MAKKKAAERPAKGEKKEPSPSEPESASTSVAGVIFQNALYTKEDFCRRMRWGRTAWNSALDRGLKVRRTARRVYVLGEWAFEYFKSVADDEVPVNPTSPGRTSTKQN